MHIPVLKEETIDLLNIKRGGKYVDATLGLGGHTIEIAKRGGNVLGIEIDEEELAKGRSRVKEAGVLGNVTLVQGNFKDIRRIAGENDFTPCDGVLFDLGMSSWQLEESGRGFSFQKDEPLDMRMDKSLAVTAADLLNGLGKNELSELFQKYGEEQSARRIAGAVVSARALKPFETTRDLVEVVEKVKGRRDVKSRLTRHPATKVFQALRIAVNDEIGNLRSALPQAFEILGVGGRVVAISFHSLEEREVKRFIKGVESERKAFRLSAQQPSSRGANRGRALAAKPITPSTIEVERNPRSRSAKLRAVEKLDGKEKNKKP